MKLSIILILSGKEEENSKTLSFLKGELTGIDAQIQLLVYGVAEGGYPDAEPFSGQVELTVQEGAAFADECHVYRDAACKVTGDYVTQMYGGDVWSEGAVAKVLDGLHKYPEYGLAMMQKIMPEGVPGAFSGEIPEREVCRFNLRENIGYYPFYFGGTFVKAELLREYEFHPELGLEAERDFFLAVCAKEMKVLYFAACRYFSSQEREGDDTFYKGIYEPAWYEQSFTDFWIPFLTGIKETYGEIPQFIQYHVMFTIRSRIESNLNNKNKHVIEEGRETECLKLIGQTLQFLDDRIIFNCRKVPECIVTDSMKWIYGILKYGEDFHFQKSYLAGEPYYSCAETVFNRISNLKTNILFMDYRDGRLEVDGTVHPILFSMAEEVYFLFDEKKYKLQYNERYALTKVFGVSIYKSHSFHVSLPMKDVKDVHLYCMAKIDGELTEIQFSYESHFSRMSGAFDNSYWCFGSRQRYMVIKDGVGLKFSAIRPGEQRKQERKLSLEMLLKMEKKAWLFLAIRKAYFFVKPFMKRRPIWMYLDKIYKAGDSAEYLYRYASRQDNNIQHYYLVDKKAADYARLKKDGFKPLVRGSIKHRLVFLMADMMVISNSTVFAFNNFGMHNSRYVRDLTDFHVCCVQHGMSVQKIAVAQNRLRDNTRLYFCASQYEIENLSRPVYDYVGYDALKLTGVPRYDGLVNDDKKQIMISPTWRMQAAVPVRTNEGEQRDYNPLFRESTYFKVFNSLINDERLIEAARKYGYKIKYVLHPIVSAQAEDFDKNDFVDVVPAVGDMSYEKMFCESSLMVTDFSGIQFDFAYMRKPLVYLHHKDIPQHYEEGTFFYDTMAFGEICHDNDELIGLLCEYMKNGCKMKEEYVKRADDFFYYRDRKNCERIYKIMLEYQDKYIKGMQEDE